MNHPAPIKIVAENLAEGARSLAPGHGTRRPVEASVAEARAILENFAGLPAFDAEEAEARLHLNTIDHRVVVRFAGGRLVLDEGVTFVFATVEEIIARLGNHAPAAVTTTGATAPGSTTATAPALAEAPVAVEPAAGRGRRKIWILSLLLVLFAAAAWWSVQPESIDGVEWVSGEVEQSLLRKAAGDYVSESEHLRLDPEGQLVVTTAAGAEIMRSPLRVGRRANASVFVTEGGVILEFDESGVFRLDRLVYRRTPAKT
jgi:hypothetical protein